MAAVNKQPLDMSKAEHDFYNKTPKHVLFAICKDFSMRCVGEQESIDNPELLIKEIKETVQILKNNGLLP